MPTTNKRVNLTIPETLYERLQRYKAKYGISSDAAACLQLVIRQLDSIDESEQMLSMMKKFSTEELKQLADIGFESLKSLEKQKNGTEI